MNDPNSKWNHVDLDRPDIVAGALREIKCGNCGAEPGENCSTMTIHSALGKKMPSDFAHVYRRMDFYEAHESELSQSVDDLLGPVGKPPAAVKAPSAERPADDISDLL